MSRGGKNLTPALSFRKEREADKVRPDRTGVDRPRADQMRRKPSLFPTPNPLLSEGEGGA